MDSLKAILKTRRGRLALLLVILGITVLCVFGLLREEAELPVISLAAEKIPLHFLEPIVGAGAPLSLLGPLFLVSEVDPTPGIYNTLTATWLTMAILIGLGLGYNRAVRRAGPPSRFRLAVEAVGEGLYNFMWGVGGEHARLFFPLVATFFLFIAISNWCGVLPGFGSVGVRVAHHGAEPAAVEAGEEEAIAEHGDEHPEAEAAETELVPFFRSADAHLSTTLALAIVSVAATQYFGFKVLGPPYSRKYLNFRAASPKPDPASQQGLQGTVSKLARVVEVGVNGIVGLLEIVLEGLKALPFSFRLFGNIFAGEVLLFVVSYLFAFVFPIIFLGLELFVGLIQALIFSMLTLVFFSMATTAHHGGEDSHH
jgi:F-type H+-transporting ATPase subunit a